MGHFLLLALLWITRDLGGIGGWSSLFKYKYELFFLFAIKIINQSAYAGPGGI